MTLVPNARMVLQDAIYTRDKLETELDRVEWRLHWVLAVVLLRAVGHVLHKVDASKNAAIAVPVNRLYESWRCGDENAIFRDFIDLERNNILKEYNFQMTEGPVPVMVRMQHQDGFDVVRQFLIEEDVYRPMASGAFAGEDGRTLLDESIEWWNHQLDEIDRLVHKNVTMRPGGKDR